MPYQQCHPISYESAVFLMEHENAASLATWFKVPSTINKDDPIAVMQAASGWNTSLPKAENPLAQQSLQLTEENLNTMSKSQLKHLYSTIPSSKGSSSTLKAGLIADILKYHPQAKQASQRGKHKSSDITTVTDANSAKITLLSSTSPKADIIKFYSSHYGLVDRYNKQYYSIIKPTCHGHWLKVFFFTFLAHGVTNAWAIWEEYNVTRKRMSAEAKLKLVGQVTKRALYSFIVNFIKQVAAEK